MDSTMTLKFGKDDRIDLLQLLRAALLPLPSPAPLGLVLVWLQLLLGQVQVLALYPTPAHSLSSCGLLVGLAGFQVPGHATALTKRQ